MQLSLYDAMQRFNLISNIRFKIERGDPVTDDLDTIDDLLCEYSEILKNAKVTIN